MGFEDTVDEPLASATPWLTGGKPIQQGFTPRLATFDALSASSYRLCRGIRVDSGGQDVTVRSEIDSKGWTCSPKQRDPCAVVEGKVRCSLDARASAIENFLELAFPMARRDRGRNRHPFPCAR